MSKNKNYRKMYTADDKPVEEQTPAANTETEQIVCSEKCEYVSGVVVNCSRLNVREHPDAASAVRYVIAGGSEIQVCVAHNYEDWCEVCTPSGVEGYCMKKYISM